MAKTSQITPEDLERFLWLADVPVLGKFFTHKEKKLEEAPASEEMLNYS